MTSTSGNVLGDLMVGLCLSFSSSPSESSQKSLDLSLCIEDLGESSCDWPDRGAKGTLAIE